ncbi:hypothetical protein I6A84_34855 [Frankia sp. CNm7]|uniref:Uncharacterized protein n=1 Tax=Frankia nepalensis TaxID=1836974 RepID=A0A937RMT2_9ACTN|nr:hypothetical protein [Frankia nepalensis]MBL7494985.1 hypothetical protein [Frankia nepalensis]MBL7514662.1 hypothetical protein [Frankia nepalensis]MBL7523129.1 hypothetical protein [Frankia nepalensis]MBL7633095.1 hypothetical protein [Frankia nepalensis]
MAPQHSIDQPSGGFLATPRGADPIKASAGRPGTALHHVGNRGTVAAPHLPRRIAIIDHAADPYLMVEQRLRPDLAVRATPVSITDR